VLGGTLVAREPGRYEWGRDGEVLRCPWHAWEFDVTTGRSLWGEDAFRLAVYPVTVVDGDVIIGARTARRRAA
jgi:3-phenylpropionate/trans-cinnamate dioxygenase ferredoxin subunit